MEAHLVVWVSQGLPDHFYLEVHLSSNGIDVITAQTILSEIGTDISKFKTEDHFVSWLGLTPAKDITGGKIIGSGWRKVQNRVAIALRMAATTLLESKTYLGARYRHLLQRLPSYAAAIKAMARYLAVLVYRMLTHGEAWVDRDAAKFEQRRTEWELRSLTSKALAKGFKLVPITAAS
jgi:transposase